MAHIKNLEPQRKRRFRSESERRKIQRRWDIRLLSCAITDSGRPFDLGFCFAQGSFSNPKFAFEFDELPDVFNELLPDVTDMQAWRDYAYFFKGAAVRFFTTCWLRSLSYEEYLQTAYWRNLREKILKAWDYECALDASHKATEVHHRTYQRLGMEQPNDLIALCSSCHRKFHGKS